MDHQIHAWIFVNDNNSAINNHLYKIEGYINYIETYSCAVVFKIGKQCICISITKTEENHLNIFILNNDLNITFKYYNFINNKLFITRFVNRPTIIIVIWDHDAYLYYFLSLPYIFPGQFYNHSDGLLFPIQPSIAFFKYRKRNIPYSFQN